MDTWESLKTECLACKGCSLADTRHNVVFGDGAENAEILFIGEGPGQNEDEQGLPFVGRAGKLLDEMLEMVNLDRSKVNMGKEACIDYLRSQVALIRPKIIVCLGRIAAKVIIKDDFRITQEHGQWFERNGLWMTALYHPAALLRDVNKRPATFEDLKAIQTKARELCEHTEL